MYRSDLDVLKGISIIAVVLFHLGVLKSGYLGVDAFFVINGFLILPSLFKKIERGDFSYVEFLGKRLIRLLPLIVLASILSLILGVFLMMPDDLENLAQSVIASNFMSQNILSALTTGNYWAISNDFRPLMHLWYVGVLFEFYLLLPILLVGANKLAKAINKDAKKSMTIAIMITSLVSLLLYLNPDVRIGDRFYYLQYRFFELGFGGLIGLTVSKLRGGQSVMLRNAVTLMLISVIFCSVYNIIKGDSLVVRNVIGGDVVTSSGMPLSGTVALLLTVLWTGVVVCCKNDDNSILRSKFLSMLGKMSYSIFIWHQVLLAFYRYSISSELTVGFTVIFLLVILLISYFSYYHIEKKISSSRRTLLIWCVAAVMIMAPSGWLYLHAGVVRDIPELNITKKEVHKGMFAEYCDRIYQYKDYPLYDNGKLNVLVEGISFGRDFANILLESQYKDSVNIVYVEKWKEAKNIPELVSKADYIFTFKDKSGVPEVVWTNLKKDAKIKGISTKNFGICNGAIYSHRFKPDYLTQTVEMIEGYAELNDSWRANWGEDNYVDLIAPVLVEGNKVRVFTDDGKYISPDTGHLSQAGAQWYARVLDWDKIW